MLSDFDINSSVAFPIPNIFLPIDNLPSFSSAHDDDDWPILEIDDRLSVSEDKSVSMFAFLAGKWSSLANFGGKSIQNSAIDSTGKDRPPLTLLQFRSFLDDRGQLRDEQKFKSIVSQGGIESDLRPIVWPFLLNVYPTNLDETQRHELLSCLGGKYERQKLCWQRRLKRGHFDDEPLRYIANAVRKDVVRTDRSHSFFAVRDTDHDGANSNVLSLFNILYTFALCHPTVGYCQGMSDLAAPLLVVLANESTAYICFCAMMRRLSSNFSCDGRSMTTKFSHLSRLLHFYDPVFANYLHEGQSADLLFCYRWLLLELKREFAFADSLKMMETMWAFAPVPRHLSVLSLFDVDLTLTFSEQRSMISSESVPIRRVASEEDMLSTAHEEDGTLVDSGPLRIGTETEHCPGDATTIMSSGVCHAAVMRSLLFGGKSDGVHSRSSGSYPPMSIGYGRLVFNGIESVPRRTTMNGDEQQCVEKANGETLKQNVDTLQPHETSNILGPMDLHLQSLIASFTNSNNNNNSNSNNNNIINERHLKACVEWPVSDRNDRDETLTSQRADKIIATLLDSPVAVADEAADSDDNDTYSNDDYSNDAASRSHQLTLDDIYDICVAQQTVVSSPATSRDRSRQTSGTDSGSSGVSCSSSTSTSSSSTSSTSSSTSSQKSTDLSNDGGNSALQGEAATSFTQSLETVSIGGPDTVGPDQEVQVVNVESTLPLLPRPSDLGDGNPFLMFACLALLFEHRDLIIRKRMDFNEMAILFDRQAGKRPIGKVLQRARVLYGDYLRTTGRNT